MACNDNKRCILWAYTIRGTALSMRQNYCLRFALDIPQYFFLVIWKKIANFVEETGNHYSLVENSMKCPLETGALHPALYFYFFLVFSLKLTLCPPRKWCKRYAVWLCLQASWRKRNSLFLALSGISAYSDNCYHMGNVLDYEWIPFFHLFKIWERKPVNSINAHAKWMESSGRTLLLRLPVLPMQLNVEIVMIWLWCRLFKLLWLFCYAQLFVAMLQILHGY